MTEELTLATVIRRLDADLLAADFQWSILAAAACNYRHDTVLRPFPPMFIIRPVAGGRELSSLVENRNYTEMAKAVSLMPSFSKSAREALTSCLQLDNSLLELLHWTLSNKTYSLKTCDVDVFSEITALTGQSVHVPTPDYIFSVTYTDEFNERFNTMRADRPLFCAYHGSRLENFHSILNYGLQGHMNKNAVFGEGTYLSSELSVCLHYSPTGTGWDKSVIGCQLSCVAFCEIIDDPSVKCKTHDNSDRPSSENGSTSRNQSTDSRARIAGSMGGDVPEKYYIVQNNEVICIKYLLVYANKSSSHRQSTSWLQRHRFILVIGLYGILLIVLALCKSSFMKSLFRW